MPLKPLIKNRASSDTLALGDGSLAEKGVFRKFRCAGRSVELRIVREPCGMFA